jgi:hypothetical protein
LFIKINQIKSYILIYVNKNALKNLYSKILQLSARSPDGFQALIFFTLEGLKMTVTSREQAWAEANKIFPTDYEKDYASSERAGYDIYRHATLNYYNRICDLGDRLEVLTGEYGENVTNIWIETPRKGPLTFTAVISYQIHDGSLMTKTMDGVEKVERAWEKIGCESTEVVRVYERGHTWATWAAGSIVSINLTAE